MTADGYKKRVVKFATMMLRSERGSGNPIADHLQIEDFSDKLSDFMEKILFITPRKSIEINSVIESACIVWGITLSDFWEFSRVNKRQFTEVRHAVCKFCLDRGIASSTELGRKLNGKDHSTILSGRDTANDLIDTDHRYRERYDTLKQIMNRIQDKEIFKPKEKI